MLSWWLILYFVNLNTYSLSMGAKSSVGNGKDKAEGNGKFSHQRVWNFMGCYGFFWVMGLMILIALKVIKAKTAGKMKIYNELAGENKKCLSMTNPQVQVRIIELFMFLRYQCVNSEYRQVNA